jgi:uncharacterized protein with gpF-like domain
MSTVWESELAGFLTELSAVQSESLDVLARKREALVSADREGLAAVSEEEGRLIERLQGCLTRREALLKRAAEEGLPSDSIRTLAKTVSGSRGELAGRANQAAIHARLLQHNSLTNWVITQRTLIHLSQMLEIIATGGQLRPTYGKEEPARAGGALINQVV